MMNNSRCVLLVLLLAAAGCDRAWTTYSRIELGQPVPTDSPLEAKAQFGSNILAWDGGSHLILPSVETEQCVRVMTDAEGNATAKLYRSRILSHSILLQTVDVREVLEADVPAELFRDPPIEKPTDMEPLRPAPLPGPLDFHQPSEDPGTPTNALEYLLDFESCDQGHGWGDPGYGRTPLPDWHSGPFMGLVMVVYEMYDLVPGHWELRRHTEELTGMTQDGFDWTYRNAHGGTIRVQNVGGRRIRIELKYTGVFDPFFLVVPQDFPGAAPR